MAFWDKFRKKSHSESKKGEPAVPGKLVKAKSPEVAKSMTKAVSSDTGHAYRVLVRPLRSEKSVGLSEKNQYVFEVAPNANKLQVKEAVLKVYGIRPIRVNIMRLQGKVVRYGRSIGREKMTKKAIVTLEAGRTISIYEGV